MGEAILSDDNYVSIHFFSINEMGWCISMKQSIM